MARKPVFKQLGKSYADYLQEAEDPIYKAYKKGLSKTYGGNLVYEPVRVKICLNANKKYKKKKE